MRALDLAIIGHGQIEQPLDAGMDLRDGFRPQQFGEAANFIDRLSFHPLGHQKGAGLRRGASLLDDLAQGFYRLLVCEVALQSLSAPDRLNERYEGIRIPVRFIDGAGLLLSRSASGFVLTTWREKRKSDSRSPPTPQLAEECINIWCRWRA